MKNKLLTILLVLEIFFIVFVIIHYYLIDYPPPYTYIKFEKTPDAKSNN
jgi:hypothetical protein